VLALSAEEINIVRRACEPIEARHHQAFMAEVVSALECFGAQVGPAIVTRTVATLQHRYLTCATGRQQPRPGYHRRP
jgi:hypothetical protein